ncbi:ribonuclease H family protein [Psychrobium sp. MM17-31]|uniref:ribonuclease H family protein n=1 Tax=Psychrobium sp. MM17-31 TaxID=2917758 RepID=UPI001EF4E568|nr:ribonuclease H family protein [Psychrobium sp. MM17-31]MCG7530695.1 ribonuclease H family protein [Psychrobium sp. MM17-31]
MSKKHYVVWKGLKTGVFDSWPEVKSYIDGQADAQYMGFASKQLAEEAFKDNYTRALMKRSLEKGGKASAPASSKPKVSNRAITSADVDIYCDGACSPNPGKAGTGVAVYEQGTPTSLYYGLYDANGTNNSAELLGMLEAFKLAQTFVSQQKSVQILSDSKYSIDCITKWAAGWQKKGWVRGKNEPIKNLALIQECFARYQQLQNHITISHVKGHADIEGNELSDRMAVYGRTTKETGFVAYQNAIDIKEILAMPSG